MESKYDTHEDIAPDSANNIVQDLTYVAILKDYGKDVTIPAPKDTTRKNLHAHVLIRYALLLKSPTGYGRKI